MHDGFRRYEFALASTDSLRQSIRQVVPRVVDVLASYAQAQEAQRQVLLPANSARRLMVLFTSPEAGGGCYDVHRVAYDIGWSPGLNVEPDHGAEPGPLCGCPTAAGMIRGPILDDPSAQSPYGLRNKAGTPLGVFSRYRPDSASRSLRPRVYVCRRPNRRVVGGQRRLMVSTWSAIKS